MDALRKLAALLFLGGGLLGTAAMAQGYPDRPVRVIVPFSSGGPVDLVARAVGLKLSEFWGQQVVILNRPGAGGTVGVAEAAKSKADGYTLLVHSSSYAVNSALYETLPYDPEKDFVDVAPLASLPTVLVVGTSAGVKTVAELITAAKARPGQLTYGSAGTGSITHVLGEKFRLASGLDVIHVPYKGGAEANTDTIAGRVTFWFAPVSLALPNVRDGRLLPLGMSSARRSSLLPEVPTLAEAGVEGFDSTVWYGMWAVAGTLDDVLNRIANDAVRAAAAPDTRDRLAKLGFEPMSMTRPEFARFVRSEITDTLRVVKAAGIKP